MHCHVNHDSIPCLFFVCLSTLFLNYYYYFNENPTTITSAIVVPTRHRTTSHCVTSNIIISVPASHKLMYKYFIISPGGWNGMDGARRDGKRMEEMKRSERKEKREERMEGELERKQVS